jgi:hypothetical protein
MNPHDNEVRIKSESDLKESQNGLTAASVLRWIAVLPGAYLAYFLTSLLSIVLLPCLLQMFCFGAILMEWTGPILMGALGGLGGVAVGAWIAPSHRIGTARVLAGLLWVNAVASLILETTGSELLPPGEGNERWMSVCACLAAAVAGTVFAKHRGSD